MITKRISLKVVLALVLFFSFQFAFAVIPPTLNHQGFLTDNNGVPVNGSVNITFRIYDVDLGGTALWTDSRTVTVDQGVFSVELGTVPPFPIGLFETPLWLGLTVDADAEMSPRRPITSAGFAFKAGDADTLEGSSAASLDQSAHVSDAANPHNVTATQVGAISGAELTTHAADADAHHTKTTSFTDLTDTATDAQVPDTITINQAANANTVDGLHASGTPAVGQLLALDGGGKFPNSTLYMGHGSGLNADMIDGFHAASFSTSTHAHYSLNAFDGNPLEAVFVDVAGRVGIGTTTPVGLFTTNSDAGDGAGSYANGLVFTNSSYLPQLGPWTHAALWSDGQAGYGGELVFGTDGDGVRNTTGITEHMRIDKDGNVGIGTSTPDHKLHVAGLAKFELGGGSIAISTPFTRPGLISFAPNGHRRDMVIYDTGVSIASSSDNLAPNAANGIYIHENGNIGFGTNDPLHKVDVIGRVRTRTLEITGGADLSEQFNISDDVELLKPIPGMVVSIDPENEGALVVSDHAYNRRVAGIISGAGDVNPGMVMGQQGTAADGDYPVALTGRVYCLAETSGGSIEPGDLLTTSDVPGYAMKVTDYGKAQGAIIGKAMTRLDKDKGQVLVLVSLQ